MSKNVVIIEPPKFMIDSFIKRAKTYNDNLIIVRSKADNKQYGHIISKDIRKEFESIKDEISQCFGKPDAIFTVSEMFLTQTARLAEYFNVALNDNTYIEISRDKSKMKEKWINDKVTTPKSFFIKSYSEFDRVKNYLEYPLIVKPSSGYASFGVKRVENEEELVKQFKEIQMLNALIVSKEKLNNIGCIIEKYIEGKEFSIDTFWVEGVPILHCILSKCISKGPYYPDRLYYMDPFLEEKTKKSIEDIAEKAVSSIGIKNGATHTEIRFKKDIPYIIETTSRPGAGGGFFKLFEQALGIPVSQIFYDIQTRRFKYKLKRCDQYQYLKNKTYYFWYNVPYGKEGIIKDIIIDKQIEKQPEITSYILFKSVGDRLYMEHMNPDYFCWILGAVSSDKLRKERKDLEGFVSQFNNYIRLKFGTVKSL